MSESIRDKIDNCDSGESKGEEHCARDMWEGWIVEVMPLMSTWSLNSRPHLYTHTELPALTRLPDVGSFEVDIRRVEHRVAMSASVVVGTEQASILTKAIVIGSCVS